MTTPQFIGSEASRNPMVDDLVAVATALARDGVDEGALAVRHGLRATASVARPLESLGPDDFVEVADYDPHTDRLMVLGPQAPNPWAPLHALVLRAKKEVIAIVQVRVPEDHPALAHLPEARKADTMLDRALGVLAKLRDHDVVRFARGQVLAVGPTVKDAEASLRTALAKGR